MHKAPVVNRGFGVISLLYLYYTGWKGYSCHAYLFCNEHDKWIGGLTRFLDGYGRWPWVVGLMGVTVGVARPMNSVTEL